MAACEPIRRQHYSAEFRSVDQYLMLHICCHLKLSVVCHVRKLSCINMEVGRQSYKASVRPWFV